MNVIIGCEESGTARDEFEKRGHNAYSCDLKPARNGGKHLQGDIFNYLGPCEANNFEGWDLGIFHPPCTYLTITANKWLKDQPTRKSGALVGKERREAQKQSIEFFKRLYYEACKKIKKVGFENPVGVMSNWKKPDQIIQPFFFGDNAPKKTCLWLHGLPKLRYTKIVEPEYHVTRSGKRVGRWFFYADKSNGQEALAEIRSKTFPGIAAAMADQWGKLNSCPSQLSIF